MLTAYTYKNQHSHCKIAKFKKCLSKSPKLYKKIPNISEKVYGASKNHDIHKTKSPKLYLKNRIKSSKLYMKPKLAFAMFNNL